MLFSSMTFLFVFMPILMFAYFFAKKEVRNYVLLIASVIFYSFGDLRYLAIMIMTIAINYYGALVLEKCKTATHKKWVLALSITADLGFLFYFKYFDFVIDNLNAVLAVDFDFIDVVMPLGISFYTFQAMSYLIDVYRGEVPAQKDVYKLALFIVLFPQLVAGPIVKYHDICGQIDNRNLKFDMVVRGLKRFIMGLAKKVLIANTLALTVDKIFEQSIDQISFGVSWIGAIGYCLQLYFDFSGYSDMAIGLGMMFGFRFMENFDYPYISKSITEFWRRWHISLATWFKQYLYIPLGGNRISSARTYINLFLVFLVTGIWHGAAWTFVIWGVWNGVFIVFERFVGWNKERQDKLATTVLRHIYALMVIVCGMIIFRAPDLHFAFDYILRMLHLQTVDHLPRYDYGFNNKFLLMMIVGAVLAMPVFKNILAVPYERKVVRTVVNVWLFALFVLSSAALASATYNPFIYFRF